MRRGAPVGVQPGKPGHPLAASHVTVLEKPAAVDRGLGDIHPEANPHVHLDPRNLARQARSRDVEAILRTPYDPRAPSRWLADETGIPEVELSFTVERNAGRGALARLFESTLSLPEEAHAGR